MKRMNFLKSLIITTAIYFLFTASCYAVMVTQSVSAYLDSYELTSGETGTGSGELLHLFDVTFDDSMFEYHTGSTLSTTSFWENTTFMSDATFVFHQAFIDIYIMLGMDPSTLSTTPFHSHVLGIGSPDYPTATTAYEYAYNNSPVSFVFQTEGYWYSLGSPTLPSTMREIGNIYNNYYFGTDTINGQFTFILTYDSVARFTDIQFQDVLEAGSVVPIPSSILLLGTGLVGLAGYTRKKLKK